MKKLRPVSCRPLIFLAVIAALAVIVPSCGSSKNVVNGSQATLVDNKKKNNKKKSTKKDKKKKPKAGREASHALADALVDEARSWLGTPYRYGGKSKDGADCSGFVMEVFRNAAGIAIPRNSRAQRDYCADLDKKDLAVGDLVFFSSNASGGEVAHVGMYIGDGQMIHASSSRGVIESSLDQNYYVKHYRGSGRVPEIAQLVPVPRRPDTDPTPAPEPPMYAAAEPKPAPKPAPTPRPAAKPAAKPQPTPEPQPGPDMAMEQEETATEITVITHTAFKQAPQPVAAVSTEPDSPATEPIAVTEPEPASTPEAPAVIVKNAFGAASRGQNVR